MFGALAKMLPDRVFAASDGGNTGVSIGGYHADRTPFIYRRFHLLRLGRPALGRRARRQLAHLRQHGLAADRGDRGEQPLQITAYEFIQDAMGPGKYRGGAPFRRDYRLLEEEAVLQVRSDRHDVPPVRALRRRPGRPSRNYLNPDGTASRCRQADDDDEAGRRVPPRGRRRRRLGRSAGARSGDGAAGRAQRIRQADAAREDYGVALSGDPLAVDAPATAALRDRMRARRYGQRVSADDRVAAVE